MKRLTVFWALLACLLLAAPAMAVETVARGAAGVAGAAVCIAAIWFSGPPKSPSSSRGSVVGIV